MNLTLSIDPRILGKARLTAASMGLSVNEMVRRYLEQAAGGGDRASPPIPHPPLPILSHPAYNTPQNQYPPPRSPLCYSPQRVLILRHPIFLLPLPTPTPTLRCRLLRFDCCARCGLGGGWGCAGWGWGVGRGWSDRGWGHSRHSLHHHSRPVCRVGRIKHVSYFIITLGTEHCFTSPHKYIFNQHSFHHKPNSPQRSHRPLPRPVCRVGRIKHVLYFIITLGTKHCFTSPHKYIFNQHSFHHKPNSPQRSHRPLPPPWAPHSQPQAPLLERVVRLVGLALRLLPHPHSPPLHHHHPLSLIPTTPTPTPTLLPSTTTTPTLIPTTPTPTTTPSFLLRGRCGGISSRGWGFALLYRRRPPAHQSPHCSPHHPHPHPHPHHYPHHPHHSPHHSLPHFLHQRPCRPHHCPHPAQKTICQVQSMRSERLLATFPTHPPPRTI